MEHLRWSPPTDNGGAAVTGYEVSLEPGGRILTLPADTTATTFSGLSRKTTYTVTVRAINSAGAGTVATASIRL